MIEEPNRPLPGTSLCADHERQRSRKRRNEIWQNMVNGIAKGQP